MTPRGDSTDNPYAAPGESGNSLGAMRCPPVLKTISCQVGAIVFFTILFLAIHNLNEENREHILMITFLIIIPVVVLLSCLRRPLHYWGVYAPVYAVAQGVCYGGERGPHFIVGDAVGGVGLLAFVLAAIIILTRGVFYRRKKRASLISGESKSIKL